VRILAFSGKFGVGKTTIANILIEDYLPYYRRINFGDFIKEEAAEEYNFPVRLCNTEEGKNTEIVLPDGRRRTVRSLLHLFGTEVRRAQDPDYWIRRMELTLNGLPRRVTGVVIDDVRFPNEADLVGRRGGLLFKIEPYPGYVDPSGHEAYPSLPEGRFAKVLRPQFGLKYLKDAVAQVFSAHFDTILPAAELEKQLRASGI
jgi:hypothetical protein